MGGTGSTLSSIERQLVDLQQAATLQLDNAYGNASIDTEPRRLLLRLAREIWEDILSNGVNSDESYQYRAILGKSKILSCSQLEFTIVIEEFIIFVRDLRERRRTGVGHTIKIF